MNYSKKVLHYFRNLNHGGSWNDPQKDIITVKKGNAENGDECQLQFQVNNRVVVEARFMAYGTAATLACCEWLCGWVEGKSLADLDNCTTDFVLQELEMDKLSQHSAQLVVDMLYSALSVSKVSH